MINNDFDTLINNTDNYNSMNKKSPAKIIVIALIVLLITGGGIFGWNYYKTYKSKLPKMKFFEYVYKTNINEIMDTSATESISKRMEGSTYKVDNNLKFNIALLNNQNNTDSNNENVIDIESVENFLNDIHINKLNLKLNYRKGSNSQTKGELELNRGNEKIVAFDYLIDDENVAVKSDDIVIKYVGSKKANLSTLLNKIVSRENGGNNESDIILEGEKISQITSADFNKYKTIIDEKLSDEKFSIDENVILTQNSESVETTLYELKLSKSELLQLLTDLKDEFVNDKSLIGNFITGTSGDSKEIAVFKLLSGNKLNISYEQAEEYIEKSFSDFYTKILEADDAEFIFDIYVSNGQVIKKSVSYGNYFQLDIEEEKHENLSRANITAITEQDGKKSGIAFTINKTKSNISTVMDVEISLIEDLTINHKINIKNTLEGNENSSSINNKTIITYTNNRAKYNLENETVILFDYDENTTYNLSGDNCFWVDELQDDVLSDIINQIAVRTKEVINEKIEKLKSDEVIDDNNDLELINMNPEEEQQETTDENTQTNENGETTENETNQENTVDNQENQQNQENQATQENQTEQEEQIDEIEEQNNELVDNIDGIDVTEVSNEDDAKQIAQNKLIAAVSSAMRQAQDEGRTYLLTDLSGLQIPGSTVTVVVNENMAIVAVDGYTFYIDANFVLTT